MAVNLPEGFVLDNKINLPEGFQLEQDVPLWEEPISKIAQRVGGALTLGTWDAAIFAARQVYAGGQMLGEALPESKAADILKSGGAEMVRRIDAYRKQNPDHEYVINTQGYGTMLADIVANPDKLLKNVVDTAPLYIEAALATAAGGPWAGRLAFAIPITADVYATSRQEGATPKLALARATASGLTQAALSEWIVGKQLGLTRMIPGASLGKIVGELSGIYTGGTAIGAGSQFTDNFYKWLFTDRSQAWSEGVLQAAETGGPIQLAMGGLMAGIGQIGKQRLVRDQIRILDAVDTAAKEHPELKQEHKEEISKEIQDVKQQVIKNFIEISHEKYPKLVTDVKSLEEVGNKMAVDFGIKTESPIVWKYKKSERPGGNWGLHNRSQKSLGGPFVDEITIYDKPGHRDQIDVKKSIVHELTHIDKPPIVKPGQKRVVHHPEFAKTTVERQKQLVEKTGYNVLRTKVEPEGIKTSDVIVGTPKHGVQELRGRIISETDKEYKIETPSGVKEVTKESSKSIGEALKAKPLNRNELLVLIHKIPKEMGMSDSERRSVMKKLTEKSSAKNMTPEELQMVADHFKEQYEGGVKLEPQDFGRPIPFRDDITTMSAIMADVKQTVDTAPTITKIPERIRQRVFGKGISETMKGAWDALAGIDNSRPGRIAKILGGGKDSKLREVFRENLIEKPSNEKAAHWVGLFDDFQQLIKDEKWTPQQMADWSRSQHRWWMPIEIAKELLGHGPTIYPIEINGRKWDMTLGNLIDFYMQIRQEEGAAHTSESNLKINGVYTGKLSQETVNSIISLAEQNPIIMKFKDWWINKADKLHFKPAINLTSNILEGKDIATIEEHYPLHVEHTEKPTKQGFAFTEDISHINILEDKTILNPRTGPEGALIVGDFFETLYRMEEAVADYYAYAVPLRIARTVLTDRKLVDIWRNKGYEKAYDKLNQIIHNEIVIPAPKGWLSNTVLRITRASFPALLNYSLATDAVQLSSIALTANHTSVKFMKEGIKYATTHNFDKLFKVIPWAKYRYYGDAGPRQIAGISETVGLSLAMQGKPSPKQYASLGLKTSDMAPFNTILGEALAEYEAAQKGTLEPGTKEAEYWHDKDVSFKELNEQGELNPRWQKTIEDRFTVLRRGQQSWDKFDRSAMTSSKETFTKIMSLFRSFQEGALNMGQEAIDDFANSEKHAPDIWKVSRTIAPIVTSYATEFILRNSVRFAMGGLLFAVGLPFVEDRKFKPPLKWWEWPLGACISILDMFPYIGNTLQIYIKNFANTIAGQKPQYQGRIMEPLPLQIIDTVAEAPDNLSQGIAYLMMGDIDEGKKSIAKAFGKLYEGTALPMGVPRYEINRVIKDVEGEEEPQGRRGHYRGHSR